MPPDEGGMSHPDTHSARLVPSSAVEALERELERVSACPSCMPATAGGRGADLPCIYVDSNMATVIAEMPHTYMQIPGILATDGFLVHACILLCNVCLVYSR